MNNLAKALRDLATQVRSIYNHPALKGKSTKYLRYAYGDSATLKDVMDEHDHEEARAKDAE